ncbi:MAG: DUF4845 domain-containing protein [Gammaproteobacteria bacterium]|nr:DUF4845 domain-containing protein [Gammaproteobacteria bacterium]
MKISKTQQGKSSVILIIILALIGVGVYVGLQYIPHKMEFSSVDSILNDVEKKYMETQPKNIAEIQDTLDKYLNVNQKEGLKESFEITKENDEYLIKVNLVRELNLIYKKTSIKYDREIYL